MLSSLDGRTGVSAVSPAPEEQPLLRLDDVSMLFGQGGGAVEWVMARLGMAKPRLPVRAVDRVSLQVRPGEVLGLVGESGCGKSTLGRIAAGLLAPTAGHVVYRGADLNKLSKSDARKLKLGIQMIFQDPMASLNPRLRVEQIVGEAPYVHSIVSKASLGDYVDAQLTRAGFDPSRKKLFPHAFSGGQRQRIGIARALAVRPDFLVCDESVAALDVSIQAQILNLFMDLREQLSLTYIFISHDLAVVALITDRVAVMYLGRIVEEGSTADLFDRPFHPYTQALLGGIPQFGRGKTAFKPPVGEIPSPINPPSGCHFHPRCPKVMPRCRTERPELREVAPGRRAACHLDDF
jgi:oligopeptide/dipeptide ABC transporter ATP-binding protein